MSIPLSPRLQACCSFVAPGDRVADIGCDHGYLSIHLLQEGIASAVIAADINKMPLQSARNNAEKYGVQDKIRFFLSDGVCNLPQDFDTLVCAGMGADTMVSILEAAPWLRSTQYRLILQCQSKTPLLRQYLSDHGWQITQEVVIRDGRFLYTVMEVCYAPDAPRLSAAQCYLSPALLSTNNADTADYCRWVIGGLQISAQHTQDPEKLQLLQKLQHLAP